MKQLSIFDKLPANILQQQWMKDHIKNPPPFVNEEQRHQAQKKLEQIKQLKISKFNLS